MLYIEFKKLPFLLPNRIFAPIHADIC